MSRTIVVTGAGSGIGQATARLSRDQGDRVLGVDLRGTEIEADLSTAAGRTEAAERIAEQSGGTLDALVACAGVATPGETMVRVNFFGTTELVTALQPLLAKSAAGRIAVTGSISGTQPVDADLVAALLAGDEEAAVARCTPLLETGNGHRIYPSTKSALAQWARRLAIAPGYADAGIPLNVVAPGVVLTPMSAPLFEDARMREAMATAVPMPLNGHATPEDVAEVLGFLISTANTHVTGQVVYVDGGAEVTVRGPAVF
ncbi:SDR family oxidoreductase [Amycolatopsis alba]|uniref:Short-chain dehydrogenase n=1 Tax=Amycolatopsis alba DSM 44262 TaxID=1125972 RepID=A0A229R714_AMYAL|nr:SDR family oxidoreductase [Amycolatopsis alba]OXM42406.1 short-chain dehydrogenase [Amycolatopsis alba DSM 44262]